MTATAEIPRVEKAPEIRPLPQPRPLAVLLSRFPSVTETFVLREIIELERQGQPVRLVPMLRESPPVVHEEARPWVLRALYTKFVDPQIAAANARMFRRNPARYLVTLAGLILGTFRYPDVLIRTLAVFPKSVFLAERLEEDGITHIHAHFATHPATMALIIATFSKISFSFTVHAHDIQINRALLRTKLREARFIRSISDYNKRFLEELYPAETKGKIEVVHVGIEPERYETAADDDPEREAKILCVAAHKPYKGLPVLIEACRILRDEGLLFRCEIVGHGPMKEELETMIAERKLEDRVLLVGPRPQDEVARMMREATLFVLPSIVAADGQMEGIPVALMEAMATGLPVVSTAISGIPELVDDGVNGFLVAPGDAAAFAEAIKAVLSNRDRAAVMGRAGQKKVRTDFALRTCVAKLVQLLDR